MSEVSNNSDDDSLRSGHRFAGNASVCSVASSRRVPKPLNLPAWAMKSSSSFAAGGSTATLSKGGDTEGNRDRHKQDNDNKNKHLVKKAGPGRNAVTSPYHRTYCAEENETLFEDLFEHLQRPGGGVHQYYAAIGHSSLLFSTSWMEDGIFEEKHLGAPSVEVLILCLRVDLVPKSDLPVLLELARTCQLDEMVREAVVRLKWTDRFPKVASPSSKLLVRNKDVLKSLLFLARVICALDFLERFERLDDESPNLLEKCFTCLRLVDAAAELKQQKKRCNRKSQDAQDKEPQVDLKDYVASPEARITKREARVVLDEDDVEQGQNRRSACREDADKKRLRIDDTDDDCPHKRRQSKKRRVSLEWTCSSPDEILSTGDLTTVSLMERFGQLQQYFKEGIASIQLLHLDYQKKEEEYKGAMGNSTSQSHGERGNEDGSDTSSNVDMVSLRFDRLQLYFHKGLGAMQQLQFDYQQKEEQYKAALNRRIWQTHPQCSDEDTSASHSNTEFTGWQAVKKSSTGGLGDARRSIGGTRQWDGDFEDGEEQSDESGVALYFKEDNEKEVDVAMEEIVRSVVREKIFPEKKFLKGKKQLAKAMKYIAEQGMPNGVDGLGMSFEDWSARYSAEVRWAFISFRTNIELAMQQTVNKYLDEHNGSLISIKDLGRLRESRSLVELNAFTWFWDVLLECVSATWEKKKHERLISEAVTISDEAFAIFLFENHRDTWIASWKKDRHGTNIEIPAPLYAPMGVDHPSEFRPWSEAGTKRLRELCKLVASDREKDEERERRILSMVRKHHGLPPLA